MASDQKSGKHAPAAQTTGTVSHAAQQRVDRRVMEIMARRDAAKERDTRPEVVGHR